MANIRNVWMIAHRWSGLGIAAFLIVAGITGSVLVYETEVERWLNPGLFIVAPRGAPLPPLELRERAERIVPKGYVAFVDLAREPDEAAIFFVNPRTDPVTGRPYELEDDQIFLNPYSGELLGSRYWGRVAPGREHLVPLLYRLHYEMALPAPWGQWLLGAVALVWLINCVIGFYLTLPARRGNFLRGWKRAWLMRWPVPFARLSFDFHRASGLWVWGMLAVLALSAVEFNLHDEVFAPAVRTFTSYERIDDLANKVARPARAADAAAMGWEKALGRGRDLMAARAQREGFVLGRERRLSFEAKEAAYVYSTESSLDIDDLGGDTEIMLSAVDGRELAFWHPGANGGSAFAQWLAALHMAHVWGWPYRLFVSLMGFVIVALSVAGFIVWLKRRPARGGGRVPAPPV